MNCQFVLLFASLMSICATYDIHKFMTADEIKSTFHVDRHDLVPEYEVVHIHHNVRRSISRDIPSDTENSIDTDEKPKYEDRKTELKLKVFGKHLNLTLIPNRGLYKKNKLKIWTVEPNATAQHGVEYVELPETDEDIGDIYQDEENQAAILLRNHNDTVIVEGSIGADLVIRPIPPRLLDAKDKPTHDDDEMFLDADGELSSEVAIDTGLPIKRKKQKIQGHRHIVYKRNGNHEDTMSDYALMEPDHLAKRHKRSTSRKKREAPYTIYPEILVIVDYDGYRLHGGDNLQIKRYFVSFWNGVDMRYKLLKGPKIRISIAGIIISRGRDATPYLERNRVGRDAIDSAAALTDMGKYLFRERRLPVYDIAVAITKLDMCRRSYPNDVCNRGTAGFAYVGGACVVNKRLEKVNSVAIIEDTGGFSGIIVAAHEVGHLLGAVHDGSPPPSYLGGPGAEKCQWTDGYIMSDLRHTERGFRWSPCSVSSFHHFLNGDTATCLYNVPHEDDSLPRVLPGKLLTLDAQCRRDRGTSACFKDDRVCAQLFCFDASSGYCVAYRPAAEGSPCGDGQYCLNGRCVAEHENIIPDYTQNTPSYIRSGNNQGRPLFHEDDEEVNQRPETPKYYDYTTPPYNPNPPSYNPYTTPRQFYQFSTTKSPYDFNDFARQYTSKNPYQTTESYYSQTTPNPYVGNYYQLRLQTTKNPYDFANFGRNNYDINNNYLKRSYNTANYYSDSSNVRNKSAVFNRGR
ncbi:A disintegrin and metalloproteinase with thrombospondin motifs like isoform X1 [Tribolium castaneum]|uniref:A disintegrin and metalloproteinase with thrombospondin motifs like isoform X1 n=1 Tax=Tribolium castaneum TaxID=7070 RepID=UPI0000D56931|nr:PREDICTED: venom metalloproteinase 3 isoform X1 [Tribolium castaneum]|eukprot:XP_974106.1 PREDICTED: venom metalloproteinase 3 isoform X1 [Tribolium castaneum]